ncbi:uncharacterized protein LOC128205346 [Mya arenaria]|nr:uncharacterized protein LOC128205346 [Mya arenaria]
MNWFSSVPAGTSLASAGAIVIYCRQNHLECQFYDYDGIQENICDNYREIIKDTDIHTVEKYNHPLNAWQITKIFFRHDYIIFAASDEKWYSVEKNTTCILLQRGSKEQVSKMITGKSRHTFNWRISRSKSAVGHKTLYLLIDWLIENETANGYGLILDNCQNFAQRVFDFLKH